MNITAKLDDILDELERASNDEKSVLSRKEYSDMPIIFTASQMKSFTPDRITQMRRSFGTRTVYLADPHIFVKQARFMVDYEDNYNDKADYSSAFPSFAAMNTAQLRTYFTWRTKLRNGVLEKTSLSYAYVYIFELMNLIGVSSPSEAFGKLCDFFERYSVLDSGILVYRSRWLTDFAVSYRLSEHYGALPLDNIFDSSAAVFFNLDKHTDDEILKAADVFSSYSLVHSATYKKYPSLTAHAAAEVIKELVKSCTGAEAFARLFFRKKKASYFMFASAVVEVEDDRRSESIILPDGREFYCINGHWLTSSYVKDSECASRLGSFLRSIDCILRDKLKIKNKIKVLPLYRGLESIPEACIERVFAERKKQTVQRKMESIRIDFSNVDAIRSASDITGEKLMTEEDRETEQEKNHRTDNVHSTMSAEQEDGERLHRTDNGHSLASAEQEDGERLHRTDNVHSSMSAEQENGEHRKNEKSDNPSALAKDELWRAVLAALLNGGDADNLAKANGVPLSMVCDEINEKFYDEFCDTVIDFDGDIPFIVPDYEEELRGKVL